MQTKFNDSTKQLDSRSQWWRWPIMPIATVVGSLAGSVIFPLFYWFSLKFSGGFYEDGWMFVYVLPIASSAVFGALWAHISYLVAPYGKLTASTVMVTILGVICVAALLLNWTLPSQKNASSVFQSIQFVAIITAAIFSLVATHQQN
jgi:uncharacterized protein YacL